MIPEQVRHDEATDIHVKPINDQVPHTDSIHCGCYPTRDWMQPRVVVHHSADGRERVEALRPS